MVASEGLIEALGFFFFKPLVKALEGMERAVGPAHLLVRVAHPLVS